MLEETLRNENSNPSETALMMLTFLEMELPAGGVAAEARFLNQLFRPLCDRIFGEIIMSSSNNNNNDDPSTSLMLYKHKEGGWLSARQRWTTSRALQQQSQPSGSRSIGGGAAGHGAGAPSRPTWQLDPVVELLATNNNSKATTATATLTNYSYQRQESSSSSSPFLPPTLLETISNDQEVRPYSCKIPFPFLALPKHMQKAWLRLLESSQRRQQQQQPTAPGDPMIATSALYTSPNLQRLANMLQKPLFEQRDVSLYLRMLQQQQQQNSSRNALNSAGTVAAPSPSSVHRLSPGSNNFARSTEQNQQQPVLDPMIVLDMLEYYLILFARFPFASPLNSANSNSTTIYRSEPFGDAVYLYLVSRYLAYFLPYSSSSSSSNRSIVFTSTRSSELFYRSLIAIWIESSIVVPTTAIMVETLTERQRRHQTGANTSTVNWDLAHSHDLLQSTKFPQVTTTVVRRSIRALVEHVLLDPQVSLTFLNNNSASKNGWTTPCMKALQPALYNWIRGFFRQASLHSSSVSYDKSNFYTALEIWLLWLEPWNVIASRKKTHIPGINPMIMAGSMATRDMSKQAINNASSRQIWTSRTGKEPSKYTAAWESYIAANLHFYTVPLAILLRRARELDFSSKSSKRSILVLQRVFRVYSPAVVQTISSCLQAASFESGTLQFQLVPVIAAHVENLGPYAPPFPPGRALTLSSCQRDVIAVLEEVYMQHSKKVRELDVFGRMAVWIEGQFGTVAVEERSIHELVERAKLIVGVPVDYDVFTTRSSQQQRGSSTPSGTSCTEGTRTADGHLTQTGREQTIRGEIKCNPWEIPFQGDMLYARVGTHEIGLLVQLTVWLSERINQKMNQKFCNLRFLADYRNLMLSLLLLYFLGKLAVVLTVAVVMARVIAIKGVRA